MGIGHREKRVWTQMAKGEACSGGRGAGIQERGRKGSHEGKWVPCFARPQLVATVGLGVPKTGGGARWGGRRRGILD